MKHSLQTRSSIIGALSNTWYIIQIKPSNQTCQSHFMMLISSKIPLFFELLSNFLVLFRTLMLFRQGLPTFSFHGFSNLSLHLLKEFKISRKRLRKVGIHFGFYLRWHEHTAIHESYVHWIRNKVYQLIKSSFNKCFHGTNDAVRIWNCKNKNSESGKFGSTLNSIFD